MTRRTYLISDEDYAATTLARHLGHLATAPHRLLESLTTRLFPSSSSSSSSPTIATPEILLDTKLERDVHVRAAALHGTRAALMLARSLNLYLAVNATSTYTLSSHRVRTVRALDFQALFANLLSEPTRAESVHNVARTPGYGEVESSLGNHRLVNFWPIIL